MSCCWSDREPRRGVEGAGMGLVWSRYMQLVYVQTLILKPSPKTTDRWWAVIFCLQWEGFFLCKYQWYLLVTFHWVGRIRDTIDCECDVPIQLYLVYKPPETDQYAWVLYGITFGYRVMYMPIGEEAKNENYALPLFFFEKNGVCVLTLRFCTYSCISRTDLCTYKKGEAEFPALNRSFALRWWTWFPAFPYQAVKRLCGGRLYSVTVDYWWKI